jgi:hypothetical protein
MQCKQCTSERILDVTGKASDRFSWEMWFHDPVEDCSTSHEEYGYLPRDFGIGGGDNIRVKLCLDCGQMQGEWPIAHTQFEDKYDNGADPNN